MGGVILHRTASSPTAAGYYYRLSPDGTRISHSWMGFVAYTFDTLAHTGSHDGMHETMGYCGSGVSMASYLCMQKEIGLREGRTGFDGTRFQTRPLYSGYPWFLAASVRYYRWLDARS